MSEIEKDLYKSITKLISINSVSVIITFLTAAVIFSSVDRNQYGLYVIFLSYYAIIELLLAGSSDLIHRFLKTDIVTRKKLSILQFIFFYRYTLITLFSIIIFGIINSNWIVFLIHDYEIVEGYIQFFAWLTILNAFFGASINVLSSILDSQFKYGLSAKINLSRNLTFLIIAFILSFFTDRYEIYLAFNSLIAFIVVFILSQYVAKKSPEFALKKVLNNKFDKSIFKKMILPYGAPIALKSLLSYSKNHLPVILLGNQHALEGVAIFSILKNIFKSIHSLAGSFFDPMLSKFNQLKLERKVLKNSLKSIFYASFLFRVMVLILLLILESVVFNIFRIESNEIYSMVFMILGFEFLIAGNMGLFGLILKLDENTIKFFYTSLIRFIFEVILLYFFISSYNVLGAALVLFFSRFVETFFAYIFSKNLSHIRLSGFSLFLIFCLILIYLDIKNIF